MVLVNLACDFVGSQAPKLPGSPRHTGNAYSSVMKLAKLVPVWSGAFLQSTRAGLHPVRYIFFPKHRCPMGAGCSTPVATYSRSIRRNEYSCSERTSATKANQCATLRNDDCAIPCPTILTGSTRLREGRRRRGAVEHSLHRTTRKAAP